MDSSTKQIVYLFIGCGCFYLLLSEFVGDKYISSTLATLFPSILKNG